jgi:hypothetical protein
MKALWILGIVMLLFSSMAMAVPVGSLPTYNSTLNATPALFTMTWAVDDYPTNNLSGFIFSSDNSGTWVNETWVSWDADLNTSYSNGTITLNATVQTIHWKVFANDSSDTWTGYSGSLYTTHLIYQIYVNDECPITTEAQTWMYIFVGAFIMIMAYVASQTSILFLSMIVGVVGILYSLPLYACYWVFGMIFSVSSIFYILYEAFWRKFNDGGG